MISRGVPWLPLLTIAVALTACSGAEATSSREIDDTGAAAANRAARAVVMFSPHDESRDHTGAVAFVGDKSGDGSFLRLDQALNHAEVRFGTSGQLGFSTRTDLVEIDKILSRSPRKIAPDEAGLWGRPLPLSNGHFAYYFNVGFTGPGKYLSRLESPGSPNTDIPAQVSVLGQCSPSQLRGLTSGSSAPPEANHVLTGFTANGTSGRIRIQKDLAPEPLSDHQDLEVPCLDGSLVVPLIPNHDHQRPGVLTIAMIDPTTGRQKRIPVRLPASEAGAGAAAESMAGVQSVASAPGRLIWQTLDGQAFISDLRSGESRHLAELVPNRGRDSRAWVARATDHGIAVYDKPRSGAGEVRLYDTTTGRILSRLPAPSADAVLQQWGGNVDPTDIAFRGE